MEIISWPLVLLACTIAGISIFLADNRKDLIDKLEEDAFDALLLYAQHEGMNLEDIVDCVDDTLASYSLSSRFWSRKDTITDMYPDLVSRFELSCLYNPYSAVEGADHE